MAHTIDENGHEQAPIGDEQPVLTLGNQDDYLLTRDKRKKNH